jgi:hypothetical protein
MNGKTPTDELGNPLLSPEEEQRRVDAHQRRLLKKIGEASSGVTNEEERSPPTLNKDAQRSLLGQGRSSILSNPRPPSKMGWAR